MYLYYNSRTRVRQSRTRKKHAGEVYKPGILWYNTLCGSLIGSRSREAGMPQKGVKVIAQNRRARHDYFVLETWEAGIELKGTEVKSIRLGKCNLKDCYAAVKNGEMFVLGMHISPYEKGSYFNTDPLRPKRLLMHKSEIRKAHQSVMQQGLALIPLSVYVKDGRMKVELALCKGKKLYDKRDDMARRDAQRDIERAVRARG